MKKFVLLSILLLLAGVTVFADTEVITRGASISKDAKVVPLSDVLAQPEQYSKNAVVTEGVVQAVCERKGCWMQLTAGAEKPGVRVTFKDYAFFVPTDSKGLEARVEGQVQLKTLSKKEADHLEEEGAKLTRKADGSAVETSFVASGVELRKK